MTKIDPLWWRKDMFGRRLEVGDDVVLDQDYNEHEDNVGTKRQGKVKSFGVDDLLGTVRVDFEGTSRPHRVPNSALVKMDRTDEPKSYVVGRIQDGYFVQDWDRVVFDDLDAAQAEVLAARDGAPRLGTTKLYELVEVKPEA